MIKDLLKKELIFSEINVPSQMKNEALKVITTLCKDYTDLDSDVLYNSFTQREALDSTGFGGGIALPHAKLDNLKQAFILIARFAQEIEWEAIDDEPVRVAIALVMPNNDEDNLHLQVISKFARKLMNEEFTNNLCNEKDSEVLYQYIIETMEE